MELGSQMELAQSVHYTQCARDGLTMEEVGEEVPVYSGDEPAMKMCWQQDDHKATREGVSAWNVGRDVLIYSGGDEPTMKIC